MRIVAGRWRGRTISAPVGRQVRPTADRVREAWMSIVSPWLPDARVLDLCAGSGALGIEAVSRGAVSADLVEIAPQSLKAIHANVALLGAEDAIHVHRADALNFIAGLDAGAFDVAFADPPYDLGMAAAIAERWLAVPFAAILGVEHRRDEELPGDAERRRYGQTAITFYRRP
ncbi:MAG TPA: RsmD family RNA methyltransferase [Gemmatimonadaceae bacterium]|jgi:16S rRNA (guanine966-N2)-methyltransferase|nr:RsmD family RNA methyltransferase [Gemmatimonadaceae bacterium]